MLIRTTYVDCITRDDQPIVRVCGRSADGERVVRYVEGTRPHFYVPADANPYTAVRLASEELDDREYNPILAVEETDPSDDPYEMFDGRPVKRIEVETPKDIDRLEETDVFEFTGEADVPFYRRVTLDHDLSGYVDVPGHKGRCHVDEIQTDIDPEDVENIQPRVLIADIEVEVIPGQSFAEMQDEVNAEVIALTFYDTQSEDYFVGVVDPERQTNPGMVRSHMEDHWAGNDLAETFTESDITLYQADSEVGLLTRFIGEIRSRDVDLLSGWNWVGFDHAYLLDRISKLDDVGAFDDSDYGLSSLSTLGMVQRWKDARAIEGLPGFDQMDAYCEKMTFHEWRSKALDYVASETLDIGKVDHPGIMDDYENNRSRLVAYNLLDVQLTVALSDQYGIEEFFFDLADLAGIQVTDTFSELRLVDGYMLKRRESDEVLPTQTEQDVKQPIGGLVLSPSDGIQKYVATLDLKSLYPSCMVTGNISKETLTTDPEQADIVIPSMPAKEMDVGGTITADDIGFDMADGALGFTLDTEGLQPKYNRRKFKEREAKKAKRDQYDPDSIEYDVFHRQQNGVKVVMNSEYGVSNSDYYRLAEDGVGDAITALGRYTLWTGAQVCEELGYDVIYGDTDSVMIQLADPSEDVAHDELLARGHDVEKALNRQMDRVADAIGVPEDGHPFLQGRDLHGTDRHALTFEFEKLYQRFFQAGSKKRYAGDIVWKEGKDIDELDVVGFESQRADVPEVTAEVQETVIEKVLKGADFQEISDYVRQQIEAIHSGDVDPKHIGVPLALRKELDSYGNIRRARAARFSNEYLDSDFGKGDTPWVRFVDRTPIGVPGTDVIALEWHEAIPDGYPVDVRTTVEKAFESALSPILNEAGWTFDEVRSGRRNQAVGSENMMNYNSDPFAGSDTVEQQAQTDTTDGSDDGGWTW